MNNHNDAKPNYKGNKILKQIEIIKNQLEQANQKIGEIQNNSNNNKKQMTDQNQQLLRENEKLRSQIKEKEIQESSSIEFANKYLELDSLPPTGI